MNEAALPETDGLLQALPPGQLLAAAREREGYSIGDVARQLKLSISQVEAIEAGNFSSLPGPVFVRGFVRNYARLLKLDPAPLLAAAEAQIAPVVEPQVIAPAAEIPYPAPRSPRSRKYAIAAAVVVIALLVGAYFYADNDATVIPAPARVDSQTLPVHVDTGAGQPSGAPTPGGAVQDGTAPPLAVPDGAPKGSDSETVPHSPGAGRSTGEHSVRMKFDRASWVEIIDGSGRRIFSQLNAPGSEQSVSGRPPLTVVVGNAAGVRLTHNEKPVDLALYTKIDVARLTLE